MGCRYDGGRQLVFFFSCPRERCKDGFLSGDRVSAAANWRRDMVEPARVLRQAVLVSQQDDTTCWGLAGLEGPGNIARGF